MYNFKITHNLYTKFSPFITYHTRMLRCTSQTVQRWQGGLQSLKIFSGVKNELKSFQVRKLRSKNLCNSFRFLFLQRCYIGSWSWSPFGGYSWPSCRFCLKQILAFDRIERLLLQPLK